MINTIIFDIGDVILESNLSLDKVINRCINDSKQKTKNFDSLYLRKLMLGQITENEYLNSIIKKYNLAIEINALKKALQENVNEVPGTRDIIKRLNNKYKLGILSDNAREWVEYCNNKFDHHKYFNGIVYSYEISLLKPDFKLFNIILKKLNAKAVETIFIDNDKNNLVAAKELGINTIHFKKADQLFKELNAKGINLN